MDSGHERTLDLQEAAAFLRMSPAVLRQKARSGKVRGAKPGKCWVFLQSDLVAYLRSLYAGDEQMPCGDWKEVFPCHSLNAVPSGGSGSRPRTGSRYADLLGLPTNDKRKSSTTR